MFTVAVEYPNGSRSLIGSVKGTHYTNGLKEDEENELRLFTPDNGLHVFQQQIRDGQPEITSFYIMNDAGATVARYDICNAVERID